MDRHIPYHPFYQICIPLHFILLNFVLMLLLNHPWLPIVSLPKSPLSTVLLNNVSCMRNAQKYPVILNSSVNNGGNGADRHQLFRQNPLFVNLIYELPHLASSFIWSSLVNILLSSLTALFLSFYYSWVRLFGSNTSKVHVKVKRNIWKLAVVFNARAQRNWL